MPPPSTDTTESWWLTAGRDGMTAEARKRIDGNTKAARSISGLPRE